MSLDLKCDADAFAGFSSGLYKAIIVEGKRKTWEYGTGIRLGEEVVVRNCASPAYLQFKASQVITYMGAAKIETAFDDVRSRIAGSEGYEDLRIYLAENGMASLMPHLNEGIYVIMINPLVNTGNGGDENREH